MVTPPELVRDLRHGVSFLLQGATDERSGAVRDRVLAAVAGRSAAEMVALSDAFVPDLVASIAPAVRRVLDEHARAGRDRIVLSASPTEIVSRVAEAAGLEHGTGTSSELDAQGRYTGRLAGPSATTRARPRSCAPWRASRDTTSPRATPTPTP